LTAFSFAALALAAIGMGIAQPNVQVADVSYDYPTNADEGDVTQRFIGDIADVRYDYPSNEFDSDEYHRPPPGFPKV
jgi:hypothetical protein